MGKTLDIVAATAPDYRARAESRLPLFLFDDIDGGANTLRAELKVTMALAGVTRIADIGRSHLE